MKLVKCSYLCLYYREVLLLQKVYSFYLRSLRRSRWFIRKILYYFSKKLIKIFFVFIFIIVGSSSLRAYQVELWQLQAYTYFESSNLYGFYDEDKPINLSIDFTTTPFTNGRSGSTGSIHSSSIGYTNRQLPYPTIKFIGAGGGNEYKKSFSSVVVNGRQSYFIFSFLVKSSYFPQNNVTFWDKDDSPYQSVGSTYFAVGSYFRYTYRLKVTSKNSIIYLYDSQKDLFNKPIIPLYVGWEDDLTADAKAIIGLNSSSDSSNLITISELQHRTNYELSQLYHLIQSDNSRTDKKLSDIQNSGKEIANSTSSRELAKGSEEVKNHTSTIDESTKKGYEEIKKIKVSPVDLFVNYSALISRLTAVYNYIFLVHPLYLAVAGIFVYIIVRMVQRG